MQRLMLLLLTLAAYLPWDSHACTQVETGGVLGSVTTRRVANGPAITGSGSFSFKCSSVWLALLSPDPVLNGRMQSNMTGLKLKSGSFEIPYQIYSDPSFTQGYAGSAVVINLLGSNLVNLLNGGTGSTVPLYIVTTPGPNIPAGTYTDTVNVTWTYSNICEGLLSLGGGCAGTLNNGTVTRPIVVSLTVTNDCTITAPTVNFGSAPILAGFPTVSQSISLQCSRDLVYTVGLSNGSSPNAGRRRMSAGSNRLAYDLFKADTTVWGSVGTARASGPAPATGNTVQTIPYTARIYQDQGAPALGNYTDNVVVDVSF
jgi:spore coat protein U-like protein